TGWLTAAFLGALLAFGWALVRKGSDAATHDDQADDLALVLFIVGIGLILIPEIAYVRDVFGTRMNTVFKFYYQGWLLLGIATAYGTVRALFTRGVVMLAGALGSVLLAASLVYAATGVYSRSRGFRTEHLTLDALAYLDAAAPDERRAIEWITDHTRPDARVLQAAGTSYRV